MGNVRAVSEGPLFSGDYLFTISCIANGGIPLIPFDNAAWNMPRGGAGVVGAIAIGTMVQKQNPNNRINLDFVIMKEYPL